MNYVTNSIPLYNFYSAVQIYYPAVQLSSSKGDIKKKESCYEIVFHPIDCSWKQGENILLKQVFTLNNEHIFALMF